MKNLLSVLALSSALVVPALSNAGPAPCPACPEAPAPKWGGFKLGLQLGYGHATQKIKFGGSESSSSLLSSDLQAIANAGGSFTAGSKGVLGGFHAGYDFQLNKNWIIGAESSFDFLQHSLAEGKYSVTVLPRVGYGMQDSLFYVGCGWVGTKGDEFHNGVRVALGAGQKMGRVLLGVEGDYDFLDDKIRVLSAKLKMSFML